MTGTGRRRGEPATEEGYRTEQFSFVDDTNPNDVIDWLAFTETRAERREERRRRSRNRLITILVVLGVLAAGGGGFVLWRASGGAEDVFDGPRAAVLFQVRGPKGEAVASAVLLHEVGTGRGSVLVVPANLRLQPARHEPTTFGQALTELGPSQSREAFSDLVGLPLDGSWILEEVAFESLVDQLGGIEAEVDVAVPGAGAGGGTLPAGKQVRLKGPAALDYATYRVRGQPQSEQLERLERVLQALLRVMPTNPADAARLLDNLGVIPDPTFSNERLGTALSGMSTDADANRIQSGYLPVRGDGVIDVRYAGTVVRQLIGGSLRRTQDSGPPRVLVMDGTTRRRGREDAQRAVGVKLIGAGYRYVNGGKADQRAKATSIQVSQATRDGKLAGDQVALTLGIETSAVTVVKAEQIAADVLVIVGDDFRP